jgi:hypothetical protein
MAHGLGIIRKIGCQNTVGNCEATVVVHSRHSGVSPELDASKTSTVLALNNQFYAGRQITATLAPVLRLSNAICRGAADGQCQMGPNCIFVHPLNPSKYVMSETFPRGPRAYAPPFRVSNVHRIPDKPSDVLYGITQTKREEL